MPFLALALGYAVTVLDEERPWLGMLAGGALGAAVGFGAGIGFEAIVDASTTTARWLCLGIGWVVGAALGTWSDRDRSVEPRPRRWPRSAVVGGVVALAAVALLVYFLPVWTGVTMPSGAVRQRWWFDGWI